MSNSVSDTVSPLRRDSPLPVKSPPCLCQQPPLLIWDTKLLDMLVPAPRMLRAVCESTQISPNVDSTQAQLVVQVRPSTIIPRDQVAKPLRSLDPLATIQEYLSEPSSIETVYGAVLDRASAEPVRC